MAEKRVGGVRDTAANRLAEQPDPRRGVDTEKLAEMLEFKREEKRAAYDSQHALQHKQEDESIKEIQGKIDSLKASYAAPGYWFAQFSFLLFSFSQSVPIKPRLFVFFTFLLFSLVL